MGRAIVDLLGIGLVFVFISLWVSWRVRVATTNLREENKILTESNKNLRADKDPMIDSLREDVNTLHVALDDIMSIIARRPNMLDLSGPYQGIIDTISLNRPNRK